MELTYHAKIQRADRIRMIEQKIGFGTVIKEVYHNGCFQCLTNTGIILVKDDNRELLITAFVATQRELVMMYGGTKKIPPYLRKKVDHNQSLFTMDGKTVVR